MTTQGVKKSAVIPRAVDEAGYLGRCYPLRLIANSAFHTLLPCTQVACLARIHRERQVSGLPIAGDTEAVNPLLDEGQSLHGHVPNLPCC